MSKYKNKAELMKAIAHPVRLEILDILSHGPECVCEIAASLHKRQPYISQQLKVLRQADLVTTQRQEKNIYYQLDLSKLNMIRQVIRGICPSHNQMAEK
ncbi:MAG: winged helix-turn-helix transcriptional regulator [Anaerolineales bacterium]|nr:winged helix-turn-helix transcriptional regulator [Anaerolineales bacterium]